MSPGWLRIVSLCVALAAAVALPGWPLSAADATDEAEVDLTVSDGGSSFTNSIGMKFVRIPKGKFLMGSPKEDREASTGEMPQHEVELTKDFYVGVYEVTQRQYKAVMGNNPAYFSKEGAGRNQVQGMNTDDFPVEQIAWNDTQEFLKKLNALSGEALRRGRYRLPTEAEWEYACRAGTKTRFHYGDALTAKEANISGGGPNRTCKVGSYKPNAFGLYDMHGNVWEWVSDWHSGSEYTDKRRVDPTGPKTGGSRSIRGGGWSSGSGTARSALRGSNSLTYRGNYNGFRVACSAGPN